MEPTNITVEQFNKVLSNEPLIESEPSIKGISRALLQARTGAIYYGTGLTTPRSLSVGLPFDVLGMVLTAEKLRRTLNLNKIVHHIADTHAMTNPFASAEAVELLAVSAQDTMTRVAAHLQLPHLKVIRSSSFDHTSEYQASFASIQTDKNDYVRRELADVRWYQVHEGLILKMGWIIQAAETAEGFDERLYDNEYRRIFGPDMSFIYLKAGRTFDAKRRKASPYIAIPDEQRIMLQSGERVQEKLDTALANWPEPKDRTLGGAINHINAILRLYDRLAPEPIGAGTLPERIQRVIDRIFS